MAKLDKYAAFTYNMQIYQNVCAFRDTMNFTIKSLMLWNMVVISCLILRVSCFCTFGEFCIKQMSMFFMRCYVFCSMLFSVKVLGLTRQRDSSLLRRLIHWLGACGTSFYRRQGGVNIQICVLSYYECPKSRVLCNLISSIGHGTQVAKVDFQERINPS